MIHTVGFWPKNPQKQLIIIIFDLFRMNHVYISDEIVLNTKKCIDVFLSCKKTNLIVYCAQSKLSVTTVEVT